MGWEVVPRVTRVAFGLAAVLVLVCAGGTSAFVRLIQDFPQGITALRWGDVDIPVHFQINARTSDALPNVAPGSDPVLAILAAFQTWEDVPTSSIRFLFDGLTPTALAGADGRNIVSFVDSQLDSPGVLGLTLTAFAQAPGTILTPAGATFQADFAGQLLDADILFNVTLLFTTTGQPEDAPDLQSVAAHEIGHLLGLDHTAVVSATMFPRTPSDTTYQRDLDPDDVAGVEVIYPAMGPQSPDRTTGTIEGTVRSSSDLPLLGAHVIAIDSQGNARSGDVTQGDGRYSLRGLPPSEYRIVAEPLDRPVTPQDFLSFFDALLSQGEPSTSFGTRFLGREIDPSQAQQVRVSPGTITIVPDIHVSAEGGPFPNATSVGILRQEGRTTLIQSMSSLLADPGTSLQMAVFGTGIHARSLVSFSDPRITATANQQQTDRFDSFIRQNFGGGIVVDTTVPDGVSPGPKVVFVSDSGNVTAYVGGLQISGAAAPPPPPPPSHPVDTNGDGRFSFGEILSAFEGFVAGDPALTPELMTGALSGFLASP